MNNLLPKQPEEIIHDLILAQNDFPNNAQYPLLIYKQVFKFANQSPEEIQHYLKQNHWINSWVDSIYSYHHYHSNTHEALVIIAGDCKVQIGGDSGNIYNIAKGDVIIFPAGVSHKNISASPDFKCIGSYPNDVDYDVNYGRADEHPRVDMNIKKVGLPKADPVFGNDGLIFNYWK
ncbi:cupin domain-containing protein [Legionella gresilensis]|uniref:cupin domain-containing protein n=1 Tax=Legionella gresilensis TaxID=91823 RepID=UPI0010419F39|nr:cupin domain-containing protein [Legionella gresilensis]